MIDQNWRLVYKITCLNLISNSLQFGQFWPAVDKQNYVSGEPGAFETPMWHQLTK